jgi:hypothetical protein
MRPSEAVGPEEQKRRALLLLRRGVTNLVKALALFILFINTTTSSAKPKIIR